MGKRKQASSEREELLVKPHEAAEHFKEMSIPAELTLLILIQQIYEPDVLSGCLSLIVS